MKSICSDRVNYEWLPPRARDVPASEPFLLFSWPSNTPGPFCPNSTHLSKPRLKCHYDHKAVLITPAQGHCSCWRGLAVLHLELSVWFSSYCIYIYTHTIYIVHIYNTIIWNDYSFFFTVLYFISPAPTDLKSGSL